MISRELQKGVLKPLILKVLNENGRMYGYEITQKVQVLTQGKIKLSYGALYPILHKLEKDGTLQTESATVNNRTRVYYHITPNGKSVVKEKIEELEEFINTIQILLKPNLGLDTCI
ncbi:MAG: PadR family transcriptional regulator [Bacteroidetes bacterium]|jgi:DNA-binding PadR family transcriptional regulator|nr:PadR family transcriptional regulator [Bacteroidota bacterium]